MSMKNTFNKLGKANREAAKKYQDFEDLMFAGKQEYHNSAVEAVNAETHALRFALNEMYTIMQEQQRTIADQQMQINELLRLTMKRMRTGDDDVETTVVQETVTTTTVLSTARKAKWDKDTIFRAWDHYRREHGLFSNITPTIVKDNWSSLATNCPRYTGHTLGQLLQQYAMERSIN